ncbi:unnamed protein product [Parajaminaea phylloscopi]
MPSKRDAALMPDAQVQRGSRSAAPARQLSRSLTDVLQCICSVLVRLGVFLFLRWIPSSLAWPALPVAFGGYVLTWLIKDYSVRRLLRSWQNVPGGSDLQSLADKVEATKKKKIGKTIGNEHRAEPPASSSVSLLSAVRSLVTGISIPSRNVNIFNFGIHLLAFALFFDSYASPYLFPSHYEHNLIFHRVADVGPTHAKVHLRWPEPVPLFEGLEEVAPGSGVLRDGLQRVTKPFRLVYRELSFSAGTTTSAASLAVTRWERGPLIELTPEDEWTSTVTIGNLWPSTTYQYRLAWAHNNTFVSSHRLLDFESEWPTLRNERTEESPATVGGYFRTWPDPRAGKGLGGLAIAPSAGDDEDDEYGDKVPVDDPNHFKFITTSCVKPDFPYSPSQFVAWNWLLRLLPSPRDLFPQWSRSDAAIKLSAKTDGWAKRNVIKGFDLLYERYVQDGARSNARFLLQLGDLIYADVPRFGGATLAHYRKLYRNLFASASFRRVFEAIPMIGIYDDHEVKNNWAGLTEDGQVIKEFPSGNKAWSEYVGKANPEPLEAGENYYTFRYGSEAAFFVLDTRRYRVASKGFGVDGEEDETQWEGASEQPYKTMLGQTQKDALLRWLGAVNSTASFKFVVSSVPFMSLWGGLDGRVDTWAAYLAERDELIDVMQYVPNVIVLSGDRHEAAVTGLRSISSPRTETFPITEVSVSPLNMFYLPVRTLWQENGRGAVGQEKLLKYYPDGNHKWMDIEVDTRKLSSPKLVFRLWIDGKLAWKSKYLGKQVRADTRTIGGVAKSFLELLGWKPRRWF